MKFSISTLALPSLYFWFVLGQCNGNNDLVSGLQSMDFESQIPSDVLAVIQSCPVCEPSDEVNDEKSFISNFVYRIKDSIGGGVLLSKLTNLLQRDHDEVVDVDEAIPILTKSSSDFMIIANKIRQESVTFDTDPDSYSLLLSVTEFAASNMESMSIVLDFISSQIDVKETISATSLNCKLMLLVDFMNESFLPNTIEIFKLIDPTIHSTALDDYLFSETHATLASSMCIRDDDNYMDTKNMMFSMTDSLNLGGKLLLIIGRSLQGVFTFLCTILALIAYGPAVGLILIAYVLAFDFFYVPLYMGLFGIFVVFALYAVIASTVALPVCAVSWLIGYITALIPLPEMVDYAKQQTLPSNARTATVLSKKDFECELESFQCKMDAIGMIFYG